jgi:hypothetical protein
MIEAAVAFQAQTKNPCCDKSITYSKAQWMHRIFLVMSDKKWRETALYLKILAT